MTFKQLYDKWRPPLMAVGPNASTLLPLIGFGADAKEQFQQMLEGALTCGEPTLGLIEVGIMIGAEWQSQEAQRVRQ
jgi:hypothetical protein